jgi:putative ABC transport system permease protein
LFIPLEVALALRAAQVNDLRDAVRTSNGKPNYANLTVRAKSPSHVEAIETTIKNMGFSTFSLLDATRNLRLFFTIFDLLLGIFGSLALTVATIGIINTLVMAILERRREIGILKALGFTRAGIVQLLLGETLALTIIGSIVGICLTFLTKAVLTHTVPTLQISITGQWILGSILLATLGATAGAIYPTLRAASYDPVVALAYE